MVSKIQNIYYCTNCKMNVKAKSKSHWYLFLILWWSCPVIMVLNPFFWFLRYIPYSYPFTIIGILIIFLLISIGLNIYFNKNKKWYCPICKIPGTLKEASKTQISTSEYEPIQKIKSGELRYCSNCGEKLDGNETFCKNCGYEL